LLVSIILIFFILTAHGSDIDSVTAKSVARNFYLSRLVSSSLGQQKMAVLDIELTLIHKEYASIKKGFLQDHEQYLNPFYYVFNVNEDDGFVIVSGDSRVVPVLGYAFTGSYPTNNQAPAFDNWMKHYKEEIKYIQVTNLKASEALSRRWNRYLSPTGIKGKEEISEVLPLLSTTWDQGCYYNEQCPVDAEGDCGHVPVGCVAVAVAQIMKYWSHPFSSNKIPGYYENYNYEDNEQIEGSNYGCIQDIERTTYAWSEMPDNLDWESPDQEVHAISELLYNTGIACQMNYGRTGSGASSWTAKNVLISYFNYSQSVQYISRSDYTDENWVNAIIEELINNRPVYYSGRVHAFVCDGYQDSAYFHFNWGWSGWGDGYFYMSDLSPISVNLNEDQDAIIGIEPGENQPDPLADITQIVGLGPDFIQTFNGGGLGAWNLTSCYSDTPGKEQVYSIFAPDTGVYAIDVISANGYVDYSWRASACGEPGWKCVNSIESEGTHRILSWTGGTEYHLLLDDEDTIEGVHQFYISYLGRPELSYEGIEIDDDSITSKGNNNRSAEPGETIELRVSLLNSGTGDTHHVTGTLLTEDDRITISDDYENFGDIPAGRNATCGADFDFIISPDCPENINVPFALEIKSDEGSWTIQFNLHVNPHPPEPCDHILPIDGAGPDYTVGFSGGSRGAWNLGQCGSDAPGMEQVYSFTPLDTGLYSIEMISAEGSISCAWRTGECGNKEWNHLAIIDTAGGYGPLDWKSGTTYYILLDDTDTTAGVHQFFMNYLGKTDLGYESHEIDDLNNSGPGAGNGIPEPGETVSMTVTLSNSGDYCGHDISLYISSMNPDIIIINDHAEIGEVGAGGHGACVPGFEFSISADYQGEREVIFMLDILSDEGSWTDQFNLYIGPNRTSVRDTQHEQLFTLFPNPVKNILQVRMNTSGFYTLSLESLGGGKVHGEQINGKSTEIDLSPYPSGIYFITIRSRTFVKTKKIIKF